MVRVREPGGEAGRRPLDEPAAAVLSRKPRLCPLVVVVGDVPLRALHPLPRRPGRLRLSAGHALLQAREDEGRGRGQFGLAGVAACFAKTVLEPLQARAARCGGNRRRHVCSSGQAAAVAVVSVVLVGAVRHDDAVEAAGREDLRVCLVQERVGPGSVLDVLGGHDGDLDGDADEHGEVGDEAESYGREVDCVQPRGCLGRLVKRGYKVEKHVLRDSVWS